VAPTDKTDKTSTVLSMTGNPRIDVEPHGGPTTVPGDHRFWPNPAEVPESGSPNLQEVAE
jgi:hypothetical protein